MKTSVFQIILLAVFGALAISGILIFAFAVGGNQNQNAIGTVVIWGTLDKTAFDSVLQNVIEGNQSLSGVSYVQKDASTFDQDLANAIAEKQGPDLYLVTSDDALQNEGRVTVIPYSEFSKEQFQNTWVAAADPFLGDNGLIAIPFLVDPLVLYWNRDLLASAGYSEPPFTWDQVPQMAAALTVKDTTGEIRTSGIALGTYDNIEDAKPILSMLFAQSANVGTAVPDPIDGVDSTGKPISTLGSSFGRTAPPAVDALRFYTEFADPSQSDYSWNGSFSSARSAFAQGQAALYVGFASENDIIEAMNPNLNYSATSTPQLQGTVRQITFGRSYGFAIPLASGNPQGALAAAQLLDTASTSAAFANAFGMAPASRAALAKPGLSLADRMALVATNWSDPDPTATNAIFRAMIEGVTSGSLSLTDAISQADQQLLHTLRQ